MEFNLFLRENLKMKVNKCLANICDTEEN